MDLKQALRKSSKSPKAALVEFFMDFRRTPTSSGYSPRELLNNRQMRTIVDTLLPSPLHIASLATFSNLLKRLGEIDFLSTVMPVSVTPGALR